MTVCTQIYTLMTDLNIAQKREERSRLYRIVEDDFTTTVSTKWKANLVNGCCLA